MAGCRARFYLREQTLSLQSPRKSRVGYTCSTLPRSADPLADGMAPAARNV
jgi:hypothetical protein